MRSRQEKSGEACFGVFRPANGHAVHDTQLEVECSIGLASLESNEALVQLHLQDVAQHHGLSAAADVEAQTVPFRGLVDVALQVDARRVGENVPEGDCLHAPHRRSVAAARQAALILIVMLVAACAPRDVRLGRRAMGYGQFERAARHFEAAAQANPEQAARWLELARAQLMAQQPAQARRAFAQLAALRPGDPRPVVEIGFTYELERQYERALQSYVRARDLAPNNAYAHRILGTRLLRWGQAPESIPHLERSVALDTSHAETWKALAMARYGVERIDEAEDAFVQGLRHHPDHRGLALGLAALLINAGRHAEALVLYDRVVELDEDFAPAHVGRGILLHELGREDEAEAAFEKAVEVARNPARFQRRLIAYRRLRARGPLPPRTEAREETPIPQPDVEEEVEEDDEPEPVIEREPSRRPSALDAETETQTETETETETQTETETETETSQ